MFDLRSLSEPIVQAPLAGGPSTPELAIAVCEAGGLGFVAAGYKRAEAVRKEIEAVRAGTSAAFGVNLFVPTPAPADPEILREYLAELAHEAARQGAELGEPRYEDDDWERKLDLVCEESVAVVSFTFGCPAPELVERLHRHEIAVWVTITTVGEAAYAQDAGADVLVVQGTEAGGHRGGFVDGEPADGGVGLLALLRLVATRTSATLVATRTSAPLVAAGGIADGAGLAAVLCAGASAGQIGTALMLAHEAGTAPAQRELLAQPIATQLTRAFTGRLARGMVNRFLTEHTLTAPAAYPEVHHVTSGLRAAARRRGDSDGFNLWAGQAHELVQERPAGDIVSSMGADARRVVADVAGRMSRRP